MAPGQGMVPFVTDNNHAGIINVKSELVKLTGFVATSP